LGDNPWYASGRENPNHVPSAERTIFPVQFLVAGNSSLHIWQPAGPAAVLRFTAEDSMKKTLAWTAAILFMTGMVLSVGPDLKRYIKISTM
jgi:hypothetical protein